MLLFVKKEILLNKYKPCKIFLLLAELNLVQEIIEDFSGGHFSCGASKFYHCCYFLMPALLQCSIVDLLIGTPPPNFPFYFVLICRLSGRLNEIVHVMCLVQGRNQSNQNIWYSTLYPISSMHLLIKFIHSPSMPLKDS